VEQLISATAPISSVLKKLDEETEDDSRSNDEHEDSKQTDDDDTSTVHQQDTVVKNEESSSIHQHVDQDVSSESSSSYLADIFESILLDNDKRPSVKYIKNLLLAFVKQESLRGNDVFECEGFASIMSKVMNNSWKWSHSNNDNGIGTTIDTDDGSYVSYNLPVDHDDHNHDPLFIRVFPEHNDVGVRKVWEAGACLAEFLIQFPHFVRG